MRGTLCMIFVGLLLELLPTHFMFSSPTPLRSPTTAYHVDEAYRVYGAILPYTWNWKNSGSHSPLYIRDETVPQRMCLIEPRVDDLNKGDFDAAVSAYKNASITRRKLIRAFPIQRSYSFLTSRDLAARSDPKLVKQWKLFISGHHDFSGWTEFSVVGFNGNQTFAVVYVGFQWGGEFYVLKKIGGRWTLLPQYTGCIWRL